MLAVVLLLIPNVYSQELSTAAYPSEDELFEALLRSEITYEEFIELRDLLDTGVDSLSAHLWDAIPNLTSFANIPASKPTSLVQEQTLSFQKQRVNRWRLKYSYTYQTRLVDELSSKYTSNLNFKMSDNWAALVSMKRDYSGRERLMRRFISYRSRSGLLRQMIVGSFSRRLGLGTAVGYRGKLLDYSDQLDGETVLFPDYGGSNGLFVKLSEGNYSFDIVSSIQRDSDHNLSLAALQLARRIDQVGLYMVAATSRVKERLTSSKHNNSTLSAGSKYNYSQGKIWLESTWQFNNRISPAAFIVEGRHEMDYAEILYSGWVYADDYSDLTGDSKAGNISRRIDLEEVNLRYTNKRTGIEGGMVKTVLEPLPGWQLVTSAIVTVLNRDTTSSQLLTALVRKFSQQWSIRIDHLNKNRHRADNKANVDDVDRRTRFETKYTSGKSFVRAYIAYLTASGQDDRLALFVRWHARTATLGQIDVWSNLARLNAREGMINYWYIYINNMQDITNSLSVGVKMSHRYSRSSSDKHLTSFSLKLKVTL